MSERHQTCLQDGTLALQKTSLVVPKDSDDWILFNNTVPAKMKEVEEQGYKIVIFRSVHFVATCIALQLLRYNCQDLQHRLVSNLPCSKCPLPTLQQPERHQRRPEGKDGGEGDKPHHQRAGSGEPPVLTLSQSLRTSEQCADITASCCECTKHPASLDIEVPHCLSPQIGMPDVAVMMATNKDKTRKPETGMWDFWVQHGNGGVQPGLHKTPRCCRDALCPMGPACCCAEQLCPFADKSKSYYVGDAAGRVSDFADSDK